MIKKHVFWAFEARTPPPELPITARWVYEYGLLCFPNNYDDKTTQKHKTIDAITKYMEFTRKNYHEIRKRKGRDLEFDNLRGGEARGPPVYKREGCVSRGPSVYNRVGPWRAFGISAGVAVPRGPSLYQRGWRSLAGLRYIRGGGGPSRAFGI